MTAISNTRQTGESVLVADKGLITIDEESGIPIWMQCRARFLPA